MAKRERTGTPEANPGQDEAPGRMSRRSVLKGAAGAGAAGLAVTLSGAPAALAAVGPASRKPAVPTAGNASAPESGEAVVVHVRDPRTGEIDVYRGTSHVRMTDRDLAARLARAGRQSRPGMNSEKGNA